MPRSIDLILVVWQSTAMRALDGDGVQREKDQDQVEPRGRAGRDCGSRLGANSLIQGLRVREQDLESVV